MATTMSAEERLELLETVKRLEPLARASRLGKANGLGYVVFGLLSLFLAIASGLDWMGLLLGAVLIGAGMIERSQAAQLAQGDPVAPLRLAQSELGLLGAILVCGAIKLVFPEEVSTELRAQTAQLSSFGLDIADLAESLTRLVYSVTMAVSILYQGGMALYFWKRRNAVAAYLASPEWARTLAQSLHRPH